jgi:hypothetical protein
MVRLLLLLLVAALPVSALAADTSVTIAPVGYAKEHNIAANILAECNLPKSQLDSLLAGLAEVGVGSSLAEQDAVPKKGLYLRVQVDNAISSGNAFIGHNKQVTSSATLFRDGKEAAKQSWTRSSMGGFGAGFKGSCAVLHRCTNTLGKDIAAWVQGEVAK